MSSKFLDKTGLDTLWAKIKSTFQTLGNLVTAWGSTPSDTKYPSEKLVKTSLDAKVSSIKKNGSTITPVSGVADIGYMPVAEAQATATVQNLIQALRIKPGGRIGSTYISASTLGTVSVAAAWYNYIWLPHRNGGATDDNQNYGTLIITPLSDTPNVYVIEGAALTGSSPTYRATILAKTDNILYANEKWGGAFRNSLSPVDTYLMIQRNCFFGPKLSAISVEYSTDGGTTWLDYGLTDSQKYLLFSQYNTGLICFCGKNTHIQPGYTGSISGTKDLSDANIADQRLRITICCESRANAGTSATTDKWIYANIRRIGIYASTNSASRGPRHCVFTARKKPDFRAGNDNWVSFGDFAIAGDSGWNSIPCNNSASESGITLGDSYDTQYCEFRFEIWSEGLNASPASSQTGNMAIGRIVAFSELCWTLSSTNPNLGNTGIPCSVDSASGVSNFSKGIKFTARQLAVSLSNTSTNTSFDGSANVTNIKTTGTLPVGNGGMGKTSVTSGNYLVGNGTSALTEKTPKQVGNNVLPALDVGGDNVFDTDYIIASNHTSGATDTTAFVRRTADKLWNYIKDKISSVLGLTATSYGGNAATATTATTAAGYTSGGAIDTALQGKVDKETGKGLSTNDYTTTDKNKVASAVQPGDLGTAAYKDVPTSGDASTTQVVMGSDSRLSDARPASDVSAWAKTATKPTYTASEVGAAASSHTHGNISNDGTDGQTTHDTTKFLRADGSWQVPGRSDGHSVWYRKTSWNASSLLNQYIGKSTTWDNTDNYDLTTLKAGDTIKIYVTVTNMANAHFVLDLKVTAVSSTAPTATIMAIYQADQNEVLDGTDSDANNFIIPGNYLLQKVTQVSKNWPGSTSGSLDYTNLCVTRLVTNNSSSPYNDASDIQQSVRWSSRQLYRTRSGGTWGTWRSMPMGDGNYYVAIGSLSTPVYVNGAGSIVPCNKPVQVVNSIDTSSMTADVLYVM